ncbi:MAG: oligosaccharide flippase family protein [Alphaproteobacteria bacterium]
MERSGRCWRRARSKDFPFVVFIVIARIVGPEEMGLVNLCYIYITFCYFVIMDIVDGIVNLQLRDDRRLSTLFWTVIAAGIVMAMLGKPPPRLMPRS